MTPPPADIDALRRDAADAAALRRAFARACELYPPTAPMSDDARRAWTILYEAVRDTEAGLRLLAELDRTAAERDRLKARVVALELVPKE